MIPWSGSAAEPSFFDGNIRSVSYTHLVDFKFLKNNAKVGLIVVILSLAALGIGQVISHQFFHAGAYQRLMNVENREFSEDITQVSMNDVPIVDRDSAVRLGNRKIGELVNLISQFEVDEYNYSYTQINYRDVPTRVAPLRDVYKRQGAAAAILIRAFIMN